MDERLRNEPPRVMSADFPLPPHRRFQFFRNAAIRVGLYTGVCLSLVFTAWLLVANRISFLEPLAQQRNLGATVLLLLIAIMPVFRFLRSPGNLLRSGLVAWGLLTLTYRALTFWFTSLEDYFSAFHVFVLGAIAYLFFATLSWVGIMIWRVRAAQHTHISR
jgi:hypothetical protein